MAFYTGKNSLCLKKKKKYFVGKICRVLKDDLKTNIPIALEGKYWPVFSLFLIYFIFEVRQNSTLIHQGEEQLASSKSAQNLCKTYLVGPGTKAQMQENPVQWPSWPLEFPSYQSSNTAVSWAI